MPVVIGAVLAASWVLPLFAFALGLPMDDEVFMLSRSSLMRLVGAGSRWRPRWTNRFLTDGPAVARRQRVREPVDATDG